MKQARAQFGAKDKKAAQKEYDLVYDDQIKFIKDEIMAGDGDGDGGESESESEEEMDEEKRTKLALAGNSVNGRRLKQIESLFRFSRTANRSSRLWRIIKSSSSSA